MRCHIKRSGFWSKKSVSWCAFFRECEPIQILSLFWFLWHRRVRTLVKKSGSCLPWLRENGGYKWLLVFFCLVSDRVKTSSQRWRVWGRNREGRVVAPGRGSVRKCAVFAGKQKGERPLSWCDSHALFCHTFLASLCLACLSLTVFVFSPAFVNQTSLFVSVSARLWG